MKNILISILILILLPFVMSAQFERNIVYNAADSTLIIPAERAKIIEMWAKRGVECQKFIASADSLAQLVQNKSAEADSIVSGIRVALDTAQAQIKSIVVQANTSHAQAEKYYALSIKLQNELHDCNRRRRLQTWAWISVGVGIAGIATAVIVTN